MAPRGGVSIFDLPPPFQTTRFRTPGSFSPFQPFFKLIKMNITEAITTIAEFARAQMDGQQVPPAESREVEKLRQAIGIAINGTPAQMQQLGHRLLGEVIARVQGSIAAEQTLRNFITRGGECL